MAAATDHASTRTARSDKTARLVSAAVVGGVSTCELRDSHPSCLGLRAQLLLTAGVARASLSTWLAVAVGLDERLLAAGSRRCDRCGAPVLVAVGQRTPVLWLDPLPHPEGDVAVQAGRLRKGESPLATVVGPGAGARWRRHTVACPMSVEVVRRLPRSRRCPICHHALAWWVTDSTYVVHPACEPADGPTSPRHGRTRHS